jgi:hypothetical protein
MASNIKRLADEMQLVSAIIPVDLATGANAGDWVSMKNYNHCSIIVFAGAGTAGQDIVLAPLQATAVAGTSSKALQISRISSKVGTLTSVGTFTEVTQAAADTYTDAVSGEAQNLWVIDINAEDLDVENGFDCVSISIADTGATAGKIGAALYLLSGPRHTPPPSAIVD